MNYCLKIGIFLFLSIVITFGLSCKKKSNKIYDTLIIVDAYSSFKNKKYDFMSLIKDEINKKFKTNRDEKGRIIILFGEYAGENHIVMVDKEMTIMGFREYDGSFEKFITKNCNFIEKKLEFKSADSQSNYFGAFGTYFGTGSKKNEVDRIIFFGNLIEKSLYNLALRKSEYINIRNYSDRKSLIEKEFGKLENRFFEKFGNIDLKTNIMVYIIDSNIDYLIYDDRVLYDFYLKRFIAFFKRFTNNDSVKVFNEY